MKACDAAHEVLAGIGIDKGYGLDPPHPDVADTVQLPGRSQAPQAQARRRPGPLNRRKAEAALSTPSSERPTALGLLISLSRAGPYRGVRRSSWKDAVGPRSRGYRGRAAPKEARHASARTHSTRMILTRSAAWYGGPSAAGKRSVTLDIASESGCCAAKRPGCRRGLPFGGLCSRLFSVVSGWDTKPCKPSTRLS